MEFCSWNSFTFMLYKLWGNSLVPRRKKLKIGTLQCFYIDQWLSWASAQGCLGRTTASPPHPIESSPSTPARSLSLATDLYKNTVVCLFLVFLRLGTRLHLGEFYGEAGGWGNGVGGVAILGPKLRATFVV